MAAQGKCAKYTVNSLTRFPAKYMEVYTIRYSKHQDSYGVRTHCAMQSLEKHFKLSVQNLNKIFTMQLLLEQTGFLRFALVTCAGAASSNSEAGSELRALFPALSSGWDLCSEDLQWDIEDICAQQEQTCPQTPPGTGLGAEFRQKSTSLSFLKNRHFLNSNSYGLPVR